MNSKVVLQRSTLIMSPTIRTDNHAHDGDGCRLYAVSCDDVSAIITADVDVT